MCPLSYFKGPRSNSTSHVVKKRYKYFMWLGFPILQVKTKTVPLERLTPEVVPSFEVLFLGVINHSDSETHNPSILIEYRHVGVLVSGPVPTVVS